MQQRYWRFKSVQPLGRSVWGNVLPLQVHRAFAPLVPLIGVCPVDLVAGLYNIFVAPLEQKAGGE